MAAGQRAINRIKDQIKRFKPILADARARDISESDTVRIVADMLSDMLGYDKYSEVTTEFVVRNTFVDLAVRVDNEVRFLIEAKAIGEELKENHIKQAIDYASNSGAEWVVLTNATVWQVYRVQFKQPIEKTLVYTIDLSAISAKDEAAIDCLATISREGFTKSSMDEFYQAQQAVSRFSIAALLMSESVLTALRREIRRTFDGVRVDEEELKRILSDDVIKRDLVDSEETRRAQSAAKRAARASGRSKDEREVLSANPSLE